MRARTLGERERCIPFAALQFHLSSERINKTKENFKFSMFRFSTIHFAKFWCSSRFGGLCKSLQILSWALIPRFIDKHYFLSRFRSINSWGCLLDNYYFSSFCSGLIRGLRPEIWKIVWENDVISYWSFLSKTCSKIVNNLIFILDFHLGISKFLKTFQTRKN